MKASKNAHDWHCEDHDTYGWRGEACPLCPKARGEAEMIEQLKAEIEQLQRQCEVLQAERDQARARVDSAVKLLTGIYSCMYPSAVKMEDGRLMVFRPERPHEYLQALSDRIRALPDEMVALDKEYKP